MWHFSDPCHTQLSDGSKVGHLDVLDKHHLYTLHSKEEFGKERAKRASPRYRSKLLKAHVNSPFTTLIYFKMDVWVDGWCALKRTYDEVLCLCHRNLAENQPWLPMVDPAWPQATSPVSQLSFCDINKRPRHMFCLGK